MGERTTRANQEVCDIVRDKINTTRAPTLKSEKVSASFDTPVIHTTHRYWEASGDTQGVTQLVSGAS